MIDEAKLPFLQHWPKNVKTGGLRKFVKHLSSPILSHNVLRLVFHTSINLHRTISAQATFQALRFDVPTSQGTQNLSFLKSNAFTDIR